MHRGWKKKTTARATRSSSARPERSAPVGPPGRRTRFHPDAGEPLVRNSIMPPVAARRWPPTSEDRSEPWRAAERATGRAFRSTWTRRRRRRPRRGGVAGELGAEEPADACARVVERARGQRETPGADDAQETVP